MDRGSLLMVAQSQWRVQVVMAMLGEEEGVGTGRSASV
jgi:hypothetical protein